MALRVLAHTFRARALQSATPASFRAASQHLAFFSTKYTPQHEYVTINGKEGTIGITDFAQNSLGDVVYVDLPEVGDKFSKGYVERAAVRCCHSLDRSNEFVAMSPSHLKRRVRRRGVRQGRQRRVHARCGHRHGCERGRCWLEGYE